jgi:hypothetical protein
MKVLAANVIGVILGSASTAVARDSSTGSWVKGGKGYVCIGLEARVTCETREVPKYHLTIKPGAVDVTWGARLDDVILHCTRRKPPRPTNCVFG